MNIKMMLLILAWPQLIQNGSTEIQVSFDVALPMALNGKLIILNFKIFIYFKIIFFIICNTLNVK